MNKQVKWIGAACIGGSILFCASFAFLYTKWKERAPQSPFASWIGKALPPSRFINNKEEPLDDRLLRTGNVILVFVTPDCDACERESAFLRTQVGKRNDVRFIGVIPMGQKKSVLLAASEPNKYPFDVFYDEGRMYISASRVVQVPVKVYLRDGIIRKTWEGATDTDAAKTSFSDWLQRLN